MHFAGIYFTPKLMDVERIQMLNTATMLRLIYTFVLTAIVLDVTKSERCFVPLEGGKQPVKNISCVVYNWSNMTCTWDLQTVYDGGLNRSRSHEATDFSSNEFNVTLEWTIFQALSLCRRVTINGTCMTFHFRQKDGRDSYMVGGYFFHVNITNIPHNVTAQANTTIQTDQYVQPSKVTDVSTTSKATEIKLTWVKDKPWYRVKFKVRYISSWEDPDNPESWKEETIDQNEISIWDIVEDQRYFKHGKRIRNLTPNTEYKLRISSIPLQHKKEQGYWSDFVEITTKTLEDVPGGVPCIRPSFYDCRNSDCSNVKLYWQPLEKKKQHGTVTRYMIKANNQISYVAGNETSATISVKGSVRTTINLTQATKVGFPQADDVSIVLLPISRRPVLHEDFLVEELNSSSVQLQWSKIQTSFNISHFVIVWCVKNGNSECADTIQYKVVGVKETKLILSFTSNIVMLQKFGIAVEAVEGRILFSRGIIWSKCIYRRAEVPKIPLKTEIVMEKMLADSMKLRWRPYKCEETRGILTNYLLEYCGPSSNCSESRTVLYIEPGTTNHTITGLLPGTYRYWVRGVFSGGEGPVGDAVNFKIYARKERETQLWWTGIIIFVSLIAFISGLYCLILARRSINKKIAIKVPSIKVYTEEKRRVSDDSSCVTYNYSSGSDSVLTRNIVENSYASLQQFEKHVLSRESSDCYFTESGKDVRTDSTGASYIKQCLESGISHLSVSANDEVLDQTNLSDRTTTRECFKQMSTEKERTSTIERSSQINIEKENTERTVHKFEYIYNDKTIAYNVDDNSNCVTLNYSNHSSDLDDERSSCLQDYSRVHLEKYHYRKHIDQIETNECCNAESLLKESEYLLRPGGYVHHNCINVIS